MFFYHQGTKKNYQKPTGHLIVKGVKKLISNSILFVLLLFFVTLCLGGEFKKKDIVLLSLSLLVSILAPFWVIHTLQFQNPDVEIIYPTNTFYVFGTCSIAIIIMLAYFIRQYKSISKNIISETV
ncbi:hypothetical protein ACFL54_03530 [Planctomycetota bacterium]